MSAGRRLSATGIVWVLLVGVSGCNEFTLYNEPTPHDAVESWATPLRSPSTRTSGQTKEKKREGEGTGFFFNPKAREIEKSLGL